MSKISQKQNSCFEENVNENGPAWFCYSRAETHQKTNGLCQKTQPQINLVTVWRPVWAQNICISREFHTDCDHLKALHDFFVHISAPSAHPTRKHWKTQENWDFVFVFLCDFPVFLQCMSITRSHGADSGVVWKMILSRIQQPKTQLLRRRWRRVMDDSRQTLLNKNKTTSRNR